MARLSRLAIAGLPHHVLQRGNNRQPIVIDDDDRARFLDILAAEAARQGCALHAYLLLDDHFHLLVTPPSPEALSAFMQGLGRAYVRHFNRRHGRSGTLWEGRYRATVVQPDRWMLPTMVFLDLHPVRAGLCPVAADHAWSSHAHYAGYRSEPMLSMPAVVWQLANTPFAREAAYRARVEAGLDPQAAQRIARSVNQAWVLGDTEFVAQLQREHSRRLSPGPRGRPPRPRN